MQRKLPSARSHSLAGCRKSKMQTVRLYPPLHPSWSNVTPRGINQPTGRCGYRCEPSANCPNKWPRVTGSGDSDFILTRARKCGSWRWRRCTRASHYLTFAFVFAYIITASGQRSWKRLGGCIRNDTKMSFCATKCSSPRGDGCGSAACIGVIEQLHQYSKM